MRCQYIFCLIIAFVCWVLFTIPAIILKKLKLTRIAEKIPLNWGTTPLSILPDIKDRLLAPVNHRYSAESIEELIYLSRLGL